MRRLGLVVPLGFGLLLAGCAGPFQYRPQTLSGAKWEASTVTVFVEDVRPKASTQVPHVPTITLGGGHEDDMRLPPEFSEFVHWRLTQLVGQRGPRLRLVVIPDKARAGWTASTWAETENASVMLRFRITNEDGSRVLFEGTGVGEKAYSSADASDVELAKVFRAACNDAFDSFFGSAATINRLNLAVTTGAAAPPGAGGS